MLEGPQAAAEDQPRADAENGNDYALRGQLLFKLPDTAQLLLIARASRENVNAGSWEESQRPGEGSLLGQRH